MTDRLSRSPVDGAALLSPLPHRGFDDRTSGAPLRVEPVDLSREQAWQEYVHTHPQATLFHDARWSRCVADVFGHRPLHHWARRDRRIVGVLPLFEVRSLLAGRMFLSVPYATYGGILADDEETRRALLNQACDLARERKARCLELRSIRAADSDHAIRVTHASFVRELPRGPDAVLPAIPRKARAAARRAQDRHGLCVEYGGHLADDVWNLYSRSMRRLGSPNYPRRFFRALAATFGEQTRWLIARHGGTTVAGLLTFHFQGRAMPYFFGIDDRHDLYGLSNYVYWRSMFDAVEQGCTLYDFGRTRYDNRGPFEFKRSFGFEPTPLEYQVWTPAGGCPPRLSPSDARWRPARWVWKRLPLAVTRPLGAWAARSFPG